MTTLPPVTQNIYHNNNILGYVGGTSQHFMNFSLQLLTYRSNERGCSYMYKDDFPKTVVGIKYYIITVACTWNL